MLWHPGYRKNHSTKLFIELLLSMFLGSLKGIIKLTTNLKPFGYAVYGKVGDSILVVASTCGTQSSEGEYKTSYVETVKDDALFVFGSFKSCGTNSVKIKSLPFTEKLILIYSLIKSGFCASARLDCKIFDKILLLLEWLSWSLSFRWLQDYYLEKSLSETVNKNNIRKIGCIHEMHFYARVVWRVAKKYKAKGYTVQHAAFSDNKRWYICFPEEIENGLELPDVIYVYSSRVSNVLKQYYEKTELYLGCSTRYAYWKDVDRSQKEGQYYLFVGALAGFDNDVLIATLQRLLRNSTEVIPVMLRLHRFAELSYGARRWIRSSIDKGDICMSKGDSSLIADLESATVVIGMSTTVLEEALLLGRPVVQLQHPDYREFIDVSGVEGVMKRDYRTLLAKDLIDASTLKVDHMEMRMRLGLQNEIIDYKRLFAW
tara:strand:- start:314 stop:1603 length:1290 start_codon:yes stop_codon:yes gene_type:complete